MAKSKCYNCPKKAKLQGLKICTITYPMKVCHSYYKRKQYMIIIFYEDAQKMLRKKKIFFGFKDEIQKMKSADYKSKKLKRQSPFHPSFWEQHLIEKKESMADAFLETIQRLGLK